MFWIKVRIFIGSVLILACISGSLFMVFSARSQGIGAAVLCAGMAAFFGVLAGIVFVKFFLSGIAEGFSGFLLFPRKFLDDPPFETGPLYALMRGPDPAKAEDFLNALPPEKKRCPEAVLARIELYRDILKRPDEALAAAEGYLALSHRSQSPCGKAILLAYADLAADAGKTVPVLETLKRELKRPIYTEVQKNEIRLRLDSMMNQTGR